MVWTEKSWILWFLTFSSKESCYFVNNHFIIFLSHCTPTLLKSNMAQRTFTKHLTILAMPITITYVKAKLTWIKTCFGITYFRWPCALSCLNIPELSKISKWINLLTNIWKTLQYFLKTPKAHWTSTCYNQVIFKRVVSVCRKEYVLFKRNTSLYFSNVCLL